MLRAGVFERSGSVHGGGEVMDDEVVGFWLPLLGFVNF